MKIYLVTGGAGFIGANFVKYMLKKYEDENKIVVLDSLTYVSKLSTIKDEIENKKIEFVHGDIRDKKLMKNLFEKYNFDYVVNFAAESHVDRSIENPQVFLETNILGTQNLLEVSKNSWTIGTDDRGYPVYATGKKYLQVSTDEVYGSLNKDCIVPIKLKIDNEKLRLLLKDSGEILTYGTRYFIEETPLDPRSPYSASKAGADMIVRAYGETYKMPVNITRCSNNYGPYQFPEKLIPLMIKNALEGKSLPVYGDGTNVRDWLYVEDHAKAIDIVLNSGKVGEIYNVGGYNEEQNINIVKLIIDIIAKILDKENEYKKVLKTDIENMNYSLITYVTDRLGHDVRYAIDPTKIATELGWYSETPFVEGLERTIRWYLENQKWVEDVMNKKNSIKL